MRRRQVGFNAARYAKLPKTAAAIRPRRSLTMKEAELLWTSAEGNRLEALVHGALRCALRPGEVCGLTWHRVDFKAKRLTIGQSRKVLPDGTMVMGATKADSDRRLSVDGDPNADDPGARWLAPVVPQLQAHQVRQKAERLAAPAWEDNNLVFCNEIGRPLDPSNLRRFVSDLCTKAEVDPAISPNELRHSETCLLRAMGVPEPFLAAFLGHKNTRMIQQTYGKQTVAVVDLTARSA